MKVITPENFVEGQAAAGHFLGLIYRFIRDGEIFKSQTTYLPLGFDWLQFVDVELDPELRFELEEDLLRLGAALAAVSWLEDQHSCEYFSDRRLTVTERLSTSTFAQLPEFREFLDALATQTCEGDGDFARVEHACKWIFEVHVKHWWLQQIVLADQFRGNIR